MKTPKLCNVKVSRSGDLGPQTIRYVINCEDSKGRRYHVWLFGPKRRVSVRDAVLYFNPPTGITRHGMPGWFATRCYDLAEPKYTDLFTEMMQLADAEKLFEAADAKADAEIAARDAELAERVRVHRACQAGPELLAAMGPLIGLLHSLLPSHQQSDSTLDNLPEVIAARDAIRLATLGKPENKSA